MPHFSQRILARRNALGITQHELSQRSGISPTAISAWERGLNTPSGNSLEKLAKTLNVSAAWLLGGSHVDEANRTQSLNDRGKASYGVQGDLRMRDLLARMASLPPEARTVAFKRFDQVLSEVFALFSPPEYDGDVDALMRDVERVERIGREAEQSLKGSSPNEPAVLGAERR